MSKNPHLERVFGARFNFRALFFKGFNDYGIKKGPLRREPLIRF